MLDRTAILPAFKLLPSLPSVTYSVLERESERNLSSLCCFWSEHLMRATEGKLEQIGRPSLALKNVIAPDEVSGITIKSSSKLYGLQMTEIHLSIVLESGNVNEFAVQATHSLNAPGNNPSSLSSSVGPHNALLSGRYRMQALCSPLCCCSVLAISPFSFLL